MAKRWINSADVMVNDQTGALLVEGTAAGLINPAEVLRFNVAVAANGTEQLVAAPAAGYRVELLTLRVGTQAGATSGTLGLLTAAAALHGPFGVGVNGGWVERFNPVLPANAHEAVSAVSVSVACVVSGTYRVVSV